jgi:hypothetical protein
MSCGYARMKESCWLLLRKIEVALAGRSPLRLTMFCYLRTVRSWPLLTDIRSWELPPLGICPGSRALAACLRSTPPRVLFDTPNRLALLTDSCRVQFANSLGRCVRRSISVHCIQC